MDDATGYNELRSKLCKTISMINEMDKMTTKHRDHLLAIFDEITAEIMEFRYNMFSYIPNSILVSTTPDRSPVFITSPFQLT